MVFLFSRCLQVRFAAGGPMSEGCNTVVPVNLSWQLEGVECHI